MPVQPPYQQSRVHGTLPNHAPPADGETSGLRMNEANLINRFLRGLKFYIPAYRSFGRRISSIPDELISNFLIDMNLNSDITYGALIFLSRLARLGSVSSLNGHAYFMGAYSVSAQALKISAPLSPKIKHYFVESDVGSIPFLWKDVEAARTTILKKNKNDDDFKLDNILSGFKDVVDKDFRMKYNTPCPNYPPTLTAERPKFLCLRNPRDEYISDDDEPDCTAWRHSHYRSFYFRRKREWMMMNSKTN